ncbi:retention module-containing protein [Campylobacter curvus]|uniref:Bacterial Ig-like domain-containing protein n=4 Tax=Campylobacter curvus TaxID=200 RepID=A7GWP6_CAMC5|nr:retention module-containing protein [Campylobacter curvus]EAT99644.2 hypothetical protein CCV52592_1057 [Campylobacter curvus 525.92]
MANAVGIVKQVSGTVVAIDVQGNQRVLRVGDEIMLGEVVHTEGSDSSVVVSMNNGKEFTLLGDDTIKIDQSVAQVESFGAEAFADASALQQAILAGDDLSKLEETAAGGAGGGGGSTGGGVSLAAGVFETGGHESNISANFENLSGSSQGNGGIYNDTGVGGGIGGANRNPASAQALDTTPPFVTINVEDGNSATPAITGAIEPNASAVIQIKDANGAVVDTINLTPAQTANGTYSVTPSHPLATDGDYTATIVATDAAGNSSVPVSDGFSVDTTAPVVSNVVVTNTDTNTPADGTPDETKVKFKVDDPTATITVTGPHGETATVTGPDANGDYTATFTTPLSKDDTVTIKATDKAGNEGHGQGVVPDTTYTDTTAPVVSNVVVTNTDTNTPADGTPDETKVKFKVDDPTATITVTGPHGETATVTGPDANGDYTATFTTPLSKDDTVTIKATDKAGNEGHGQGVVPDTTYTDTTAPVVSNVVVTNTDTNTPADGTPDETKVKFKVDDPTATITVTGPHGETATVTGPDANGDYTATFTTPLSKDDTVTIKATDKAGNEGHGQGVVPDTTYTDTTAPVVSNVVVTNTDTNTPADGTPDETKVKFKVDDPTATITVTGPHGETATVTGPDANGDYTATFTTPLSKDDTVTIKATDKAGNEGHGQGVVPDTTYTDTTAPVVTTEVAEVMEGDANNKYLVYNVELDSAKSTFGLDVGVTGGTPGSDYNRVPQYSLDGGRTWKDAVNGKIEANGLATPIKNIKVRVEVVDDDGRIPGNQNEGTKTGNIGAEFGSPDYGIYKENITLKVSSKNGKSSEATGRIIDNDDILTANAFLDGKHINTKDGEDTITINKGAQNSTIDAGSGDDKIIINNGASGTTIKQTNIEAAEGDDQIDINAGVKVENSTINTSVGSDVTNINGATITNSEINLGNNTADQRDVVNVNSGSTLTNTNIKGTQALGDDEINLNAGSVSKDLMVDTGAGNDTVNMSGKVIVDAKQTQIATGLGNDTVNIDGELIGNKSRFEQVGIYTGEGNDTVNIKTGANLNFVNIVTGVGDDNVNVIGDSNDISKTKLENVNVNLETGTDTVNVKNAILKNVAIDTNDNSVDGKTVVNIDNSSLDQTKIYSGDDNDVISIKNTTIIDDTNAKFGSTIRGEGGDDTVNIEGSTIKGNKVEVYTDYEGEFGRQGNDELNITNSTINGIKRISTGLGNDTVNIKGSVIENISDNEKKIDLGGGDDTMTIENSTVRNTEIYTGAGNDTLNIIGDSNDKSKTRVENVNVELGTGGETINIKNATLNNVGMDTDNVADGKTKVDVENSDLTDTKFWTGNDNDTITIKDTTMKTTTYDQTFSAIRAEGGDDTVNIINSTLTGKTRIETDSYRDFANTGNDTLNIINSTIKDAHLIYTGLGDDVVNIKGDKADRSGTLIENVNKIDMEGGDDKMTVENATLRNVKIYAGAGDDIINLRNATLEGSGSFIQAGAGNDIINISGSTITDAKDGSNGGINAGEGNDTITLDGGTVMTNSLIKAGAGNDTISVTNSKVSGSGIWADDGDDTITIGKGAVLDHTIIGGDGGKDTITIDGGAKLTNSEIWGGSSDRASDTIIIGKATLENVTIGGDGGDDLIKIQKGASLKNTQIFGGSNDAGNDTIVVESGARLKNVTISGEDGNDTVKIGKGVDLSTTTLDGGRGNDTLQISENIDFSKVSNFEKLKLGENNESVNLRLDIKDVLDITDNKNTILKVEGDSSDHLSLKGFKNNIISSHDGYDRYQGVDAHGNTTYIDIKHEVTVDFQ